MELLNDDEILKEFGFDKRTIMSMFMPNTYQFYWNTTALAFLIKMHEIYSDFWNEERLGKAKAINMSQQEVSVLASIVEQELANYDEAQRIAGVYINRLKNGMLLQADPTLKFAVGDWSIRRVLDRHKEIDSPYNTYKYAGLPPGPICIPSVKAIEAVLNYEKHDYMFFCARPDYSGYHNFSKTSAQHGRYAREYHRWLNQNLIQMCKQSLTNIIFSAFWKASHRTMQT